MTNLLVEIDKEDNIESKVSQAGLDTRLLEDKKKGLIRPEQWFREANLWYRVVYLYDYKKVSPEFLLLERNQKELTGLIKDSTLVFYGIGIGTAETEIIDWQLESKNYVEVVGIDVNATFIEHFRENLRNKLIESSSYQIMFKGYHTLFEQLKATDFIFRNSRYNRRVQICLGNTIGNYRDQGEIFKLFSTNSQQKDLLVVGFHLNTDLEVRFVQYTTNPEFAKLILDWEETPDYSELKWELDKEGGIIKAMYKGLDVFRSKKYKAEKLSVFVSNFGFKLNSEIIDKDRNACLQVYEKL